MKSKLHVKNQRSDTFNSHWEVWGFKNKEECENFCNNLDASEIAYGTVKYPVIVNNQWVAKCSSYHSCD